MALNWSGLIPMATGAQSAPFPAKEARAVTDTLLAGIREGQGTIDPQGVLECAVLLDHGRWLALQRLIEPHLEWIC